MTRLNNGGIKNRLIFARAYRVTRGQPIAAWGRVASLGDSGYYLQDQGYFVGDTQGNKSNLKYFHYSKLDDAASYASEKSQELSTVVDMNYRSLTEYRGSVLGERVQDITLVLIPIHERVNHDELDNLLIRYGVNSKRSYQGVGKNVIN